MTWSVRQWYGHWRFNTLSTSFLKISTVHWYITFTTFFEYVISKNFPDWNQNFSIFITMFGNSEEILRKCEGNFKKYFADFLMSVWLVLSVWTCDFIKMSCRCHVAQVPQKLADNGVRHWRGNATHFLCCSTCRSGCHLCFICKYSSFTKYKISVSRVKVLLSVICDSNPFYDSRIPWFVGFGFLVKLLFLRILLAPARIEKAVFDDQSHIVTQKHKISEFSENSKKRLFYLPSESIIHLLFSS